MFVIVSKEFYKPFVNMESHWLNYIKVKDSSERISRLLDAPVIVDPDQPKTAERFDLSFDGVGFHYEKEGFEMKDLTFNVPERTVTALVGSSGSGKPPSPICCSASGNRRQAVSVSAEWTYGKWTTIIYSAKSVW